jgi:RNA polymerase sigma factor (sigma-70 family)
MACGGQTQSGQGATVADIDVDAFLAEIASKMRIEANANARRWRSFGVQADDLFQEGMIVAWKMAPDWQPEVSSAWRYVQQRAFGAMIDFVRKTATPFGRAHLRLWQSQGVDAAISGNRDAREEYARMADDDFRLSEEPEVEFASIVRRVRPGIGSENLKLLTQYYVREEPMASIGKTLGLSESRVWQMIEEQLNLLRESAAAKGLTIEV